MIFIKTQDDINLIKKAASIWKKVKEELIKACKIGVSLNELDKIAGDVIRENNAAPSFLGYGGFPKNICISVNDEILHGIASEHKVKENDLITFDIGVTFNNHVCDAAFTINMNHDNLEAQKILDATLDCLDKAINVAIVGNTVGDIGYITEKTAKEHGYEVIKDFSGHGCGIKLHEDPSVMCFGKPHSGAALFENMTICIEPMLLTGSDQYTIDKKNQWTVRSKNHLLTCHCEHMILITKNGPEILTK